MIDYFKMAVDNARVEFASVPERFWVHCEKLDLSGHCSFDLDFATLEDAAGVAEQCVEDGDADFAALSARHRQIDATYRRDGWDGEDAEYVAYLNSPIDPRD
jgi:hypothetical protein